MLACAENGMRAIEPPNRGAPGLRLPLVARRHRVVEVWAARSLQQVAAHGGHVSKLRRRTGEDCLRKERVSSIDLFVIGHVRVANEGAQSQPPIRPRLDVPQGKMGDVDHPRRTLDVFFYQVEEIRPTCDKLRRTVRLDGPHGVHDVRGPRIGEAVHSSPALCPACMACWMAAMICG